MFTKLNDSVNEYGSNDETKALSQRETGDFNKKTFYSHGMAFSGITRLD